MDEKEFSELLKKYTAGQCTEREKALIETWYLTLAEDKEAPSPENINQSLRAVWTSVRPSAVTARILYRRLSAAAVVLLVAASSFYFIRLYQQDPLVAKSADTSLPQKKQDVLPGSNKAILTLSDGTSINLDAADTGKVAEQGGTGITKSGPGQLVYGPAVSGNGNSNLFNTITTPRGGQYQLVLPDGTSVWLNAASSLKFPTVFSGKSREVVLTGEAYFEVSSNKSKPFLVLARGSVTEVLGTHFNIMAYEDEVFTTTLFEGSVKVKYRESERMIVPGQEARIAGTIKVSNADGDNAMAWKNGLMVFHNSSIQTIMRQISRWYDLTITYGGNMPQRLFTGKIPRNAPLSQVLKVLELSNINFQIENKELIVTP